MNTDPKDCSHYRRDFHHCDRHKFHGCGAHPVLDWYGLPHGFSAHPNQVAAGALLYLIAFFASAGIAVAMYPVMKQWNAGLALGSVVFRALEAAFYMVGLVSLLSLSTLGQQFTISGTLPIVRRFRRSAICW